MPGTADLPRDNLLRGAVSGVALRDAGEEGSGDASGPVMEGHFAVFNTWTEIDSWEGTFLERFAPGAFKKTITENRESMKVLFQHGYDYVIGDKPLGPIDELLEDETGAFYAVPLLDARYVREDVQPGLEAGLYGASFRFRVIREELDEEPGVSDYNPRGLPERTVKEAQVPEFGPVTFPAYESASAGMRSLEPGELVAQAALERLRERDAAFAQDVAVRFAARSIERKDESNDKPTSPDEPDAEQAVDDEMAEPEVVEAEGADSSDAPPEDSAETQSHPDDGRREKPPFGGTEKRTPPWRQPSTQKAPWASGKD
jgi:HK97 family phage prohead protease